jgi:hypothetical protein
MTLVLPEPTLQGLRGRINETFTVPVVGSPEGTVWGDGIYTDDSPLAAAAVHAGIVAPGRLGFVRVTLLPGQEQYEGTLSHGVKSQSFGAWQGSYRLEADTDPSPVIRLGDRQLGSFLSLRSLRGEIGTTLTVDVVGAATGNVWGTDEYTDDSSIAAAAVHAGVLRPGERGLVKVTILPGLESYTASERNGVNSAPYQRWDGSFRLERGGPRR